MATLLQAADRASIRDRLSALRPETPAVWGQFRAGQMLAHLTDALRMATGELAVPRRSTPLLMRTPPFKQLIVYVLPIPKGVPTAPELLARPLAPTGIDLAAEQLAFAGAMERFASRSERDPWPEHPAFGPLSARAWGVLQYRHLDHHCRQFGL